MENSEIRNNLIKGDMTTISKLTGYSMEYIRTVLLPTDKRYEANQTIINVAKQLIESRKAIAATVPARVKKQLQPVIAD